MVANPGVVSHVRRYRASCAILARPANHARAEADELGRDTGLAQPVLPLEQLAIRCSKGATRQARLDGFWYTRIIGLTQCSM